LPARNQLRFLYYGFRNLRWALINALHGEHRAELQHLKRKGRVTLGQETVFRARVWADVNGDECLRVGSYCQCAGTFILGGNHGPNRVTTYPLRMWWGLEGARQDGVPVPTGDTILGSEVWTCEESVIVPGVKIGDGAVVAAGAVVSRDVPPFAVVGGNPAKVIRYRFTEAQREALLEIRWWDWPKERVLAAVPWLASEDVDAFIMYARGEQPEPVGSGAL
jgi:acetyltransferase-like isoleucine patch superfamily enzyme